jgi:hypothetical protein
MTDIAQNGVELPPVKKTRPLIEMLASAWPHRARETAIPFYE